MATEDVGLDDDLLAQGFVPVNPQPQSGSVPGGSGGPDDDLLAQGYVYSGAAHQAVPAAPAAPENEYVQEPPDEETQAHAKALESLPAIGAGDYGSAVASGFKGQIAGFAAPTARFFGGIAESLGADEKPFEQFAQRRELTAQKEQERSEAAKVASGLKPDQRGGFREMVNPQNVFQSIGQAAGSLAFMVPAVVAYLATPVTATAGAAAAIGLGVAGATMLPIGAGEVYEAVHKATGKKELGKATLYGIPYAAVEVADELFTLSRGKAAAKTIEGLGKAILQGSAAGFFGEPAEEVVQDKIKKFAVNMAQGMSAVDSFKSLGWSDIPKEYKDYVVAMGPGMLLYGGGGAALGNFSARKAEEYKKQLAPTVSPEEVESFKGDAPKTAGQIEREAGAAPPVVLAGGVAGHKEETKSVEKEVKKGGADLVTGENVSEQAVKVNEGIKDAIDNTLNPKPVVKEETEQQEAARLDQEKVERKVEAKKEEASIDEQAAATEAESKRLEREAELAQKTELARIEAETQAAKSAADQEKARLDAEKVARDADAASAGAIAAQAASDQEVRNLGIQQNKEQAKENVLAGREGRKARKIAKTDLQTAVEADPADERIKSAPFEPKVGDTVDMDVLGRKIPVEITGMRKGGFEVKMPTGERRTTPTATIAPLSDVAKSVKPVGKQSAADEWGPDVAPAATPTSATEAPAAEPVVETPATPAAPVATLATSAAPVAPAVQTTSPALVATEAALTRVAEMRAAGLPKTKGEVVKYAQSLADEGLIGEEEVEDVRTQGGTRYALDQLETHLNFNKSMHKAEAQRGTGRAQAADRTPQAEQRGEDSQGTRAVGPAATLEVAKAGHRAAIKEKLKTATGRDAKRLTERLARVDELKILEDYVPTRAQNAAANLAGEVGRRVVWLANNTVAGGFASSSDPNTIFISIKSNYSTMQTVLHEIKHSMDFEGKSNAEVQAVVDEVHASILKAAGKTSADYKRWLDGYTKQMGYTPDDAEATEEYTAEVFQDAGMNAEFYRSLRAINPKLYDAIMGAYERIVNAILSSKLGRTVMEEVLGAETIRTYVANKTLGRITPIQSAEVFEAIAQSINKMAELAKAGKAGIATQAAAAPADATNTQAATPATTPAAAPATAAAPAVVGGVRTAPSTTPDVAGVPRTDLGGKRAKDNRPKTGEKKGKNAKKSEPYTGSMSFDEEGEPITQKKRGAKAAVKEQEKAVVKEQSLERVPGTEVLTNSETGATVVRFSMRDFDSWRDRIQAWLDGKKGAPKAWGLGSGLQNKGQWEQWLKDMAVDVQVSRDKIEQAKKAFLYDRIPIDKLAKGLGGNTGVGPIRKTSGYGMSFDVTGSCTLRLPALDYLNAAVDRLVELGQSGDMTVEEREMILTHLVQAGIPRPCVICYVESRRALRQDFAGRFTRFLAGENVDTINDVPNGGTVPASMLGPENFKKAADKKKAKKWQQMRTDAIAAGFKVADVDQTVFIDKARWEAESAKPGSHMNKFKEFYNGINTAAGMNASAVFENTSYTGQYAFLSPAKVERQNMNGGLRFYSISDFLFEHAVDLMQAIFDAGSRGARGHQYTKQPGTVDLLKHTGMKINQSFVPIEDANGNFVEWQGQSFPWEVGRKNAEEFPNVGITMIVFNERQMNWAKQQDWVHYILPYHQSGMFGPQFAQMQQQQEWRNYEAVQSLKVVDEAKYAKFTEEYLAKYGNDAMKDLTWKIGYFLDGKAMRDIDIVETALAHADKYGFRLAFHDWMFKMDAEGNVLNGEEGRARELDPNGAKLLKDYGRTDSAQETLQPNFDHQAFKVLLDAWVNHDGYRPPVSPKIVQSMVDEITAMRTNDIKDANWYVMTSRQIAAGQNQAAYLKQRSSFAPVVQRPAGAALQNMMPPKYNTAERIQGPSRLQAGERRPGGMMAAMRELERAKLMADQDRKHRDANLKTPENMQAAQESMLRTRTKNPVVDMLKPEDGGFWILPNGKYLKVGMAIHGKAAAEHFGIPFSLDQAKQGYDRAFKEGWLRVADATNALYAQDRDKRMSPTLMEALKAVAIQRKMKSVYLETGEGETGGYKRVWDNPDYGKAAEPDAQERSDAFRNGLRAAVRGEKVRLQYVGRNAKNWEKLGAKFVGPYDNQERAEISDDRMSFRDNSKLGMKSKVVGVYGGIVSRGENPLAFFRMAGDEQAELHGSLGNIIDHKELFRAYPELRGLSISIEIDPSLEPGYYEGGMIPKSNMFAVLNAVSRAKPDKADRIEVKVQNKDDILDILSHEIQHAIQQIEDFSPGTNPSQMYNQGNLMTREEYRDRLLPMKKAGLDEDTQSRNTFANYMRTAGETEARDTSSRRSMTPEMRREFGPMRGQDHERIIPLKTASRSIPTRTQANGPVAARLQAAPRTPGDMSRVWAMRPVGRLTDAIRNFQNRMVDVKDAVWSIENTFGKMPDQLNIDANQKVYLSMLKNAVEQRYNYGFKPILEAMAHYKETPESAGQYLIDRRIPEFNDLMSTRNPNWVPTTPNTTAEAQARIAAIPPARMVGLNHIADMVDEFRKETHKQMVAYDLESQATIDAWEREHPSWISFQREGADDYGFGGDGTGQGFNVKGSMGKVAFGSSLPINPEQAFASLISTAENTIKRGIKNSHVGHAVYGAAIMFPNPSFWKAIRPADVNNPSRLAALAVQLENELGIPQADTMNLFKEDPQPTLDPRTKQAVYKVNPQLRNAPYAFATRVNGENRYVFFNKRDERAMAMARALKNQDLDPMMTELAQAAKFTRYYASVSTQWNPFFGIKNLGRDALEAAVTLQRTPLAGMQVQLWTKTPKAIFAGWRRQRAMRGHMAVGTKTMDRWNMEFIAEGGPTGHLDYFENNADRAKQLNSEMKYLAMNGWKKGLWTAGKYIKGLSEDFNTSMENATRLSAYILAKEKGMSGQEAAILAKELTVNFNDKGRKSSNYNALFAFFNAAVQGTATVARTMFEQTPQGKTQLSRVGKQVIAGGFLLGGMQTMLLMGAGFEPDQPPDWVKDNNFIIPNPADPNHPFMIPMPLGFSFLVNMGRRSTEMALGFTGQTPGKQVVGMATMLANAQNPLGDLETGFAMVTPTPLKPFESLRSNKDWKNQPIAWLDFNSQKPTPGFTRARDTATWTSKQISAIMDYVTGGDGVSPGAWSPTPDQLDFLAASFTGGLGREVTKIGATTEALRTGDPLPSYKVPLVSSYVTTTGGPSVERTTYYANLAKAYNNTAHIEDLTERGGDVDAYLTDHPEAYAAESIAQIDGEIKKLHAARKEAKEQGDMVAAKEADAAMMELMAAANQIAKESRQ